MRITSSQLRQIIREELESAQVSNPLEGEYAGYIMAYDARYDKKFAKSFFLRVNDFLKSANAGILSPELQKDLLIIGEQLNKGFNDPDQMSQRNEEKLNQLFKDIGVEYHREMYNDAIRNRFGTGSNISSIAMELQTLLTDPVFTDYRKVDTAEFLKKKHANSLNIYIKALKEKLAALPEEDIIELKHVNHMLNSILKYYPRLSKGYKAQLVDLMKSGYDGLMQAGALLDSLN